MTPPPDPSTLLGLRLRDLLRRVAQAPSPAFLQRCKHALLLRLPGEARLPATPELSLRTPGSARRRLATARLEALAAQVRAGADTLGSGALFLPTPRGGEPINLGSDPLRCELVVGSEGVDPRHAQLAWTGSRWTLTDQEAPGGTWVEERRLPAGIPFPLVGAQLVRLGSGFRALFLAPQQLHRLAGYVSPRPSAAPRASAPLRIGPQGVVFRAFAQAVRRLEPRAFLERYPGPFLLQTVGKGRRAGDSRLHVVPRERAGALVIGRARGSAVLLDHKTVSGRHARLSEHPRVGWRIQDLESANGTWINGERLPVGVTVALADGSALRLGSYRTMVLSSRRVLELTRLLCGSRSAPDTGWAASAPALIERGDERVVLFDDARPPAEGRLGTIGQVQDLLIWLERRRRTGTLRFTPGDGPPTEGHLTFARGRVLVARIGPHRGRRALERICLSPGGAYAFCSHVEPEETDLDVSIYQFLCTELGTAQLLRVGIETLDRAA